jgi:hypothetical protein
LNTALSPDPRNANQRESQELEQPFNREIGFVEDCAQRAKAKILVIRDNDTTMGRFSQKNDMAAALSLDHETNSLQGFNEFLA